MISVYGSTGFVGSCFAKMHPDSTVRIPRDQNTPASDDVLYLISTTHNYHVFDDPHKDVDTNLTKLIDVLEACRIHNASTVFNFVSSWFVYGKKEHFPVKETDECNPEGFYSITKHAAERLVASYCNTFGMRYRIMRLTNIIGETATDVSIKRNALQYLIGTLFEGGEINLYNNGSDVRDFMHVEDACRAMMLCMKNAPLGETINISNSDPHSIGDVVRYARSMMGERGSIRSVEPPQFHKVVQSKDMHLDNSKLLSYGYAPSISVHQAVRRIVDRMADERSNASGN